MESREDILTSNVFSFFKYSDRNVYLKMFIEKIGINVSHKELQEAEFIFWPKYDDKTEPDVVIIIGNYYLLFEVKYLSNFYEDQIKREIEGGLLESKNLRKEFYYIVLTQDYCYKEEIFEVAIKMIGDHFKWINWQCVSHILANHLDEYGNNSPDFLFASDLYNLLKRKNLRGYHSFVHLSYPYSGCGKYIFFSSDSARYRGNFIGFTNALVANPYIYILGKKYLTKGGIKMPKDLIEQTQNALDFVRKLYLETFYLIKEIEGLLNEKGFVILKPKGYIVTVKTSTSLETWGVEEWLPKTLTVCFGKKEFIEGKKQTSTKFRKGLKLLVLHIDIFDKKIKQPRLLFGIIENIKNKKEGALKFENHMWEFAYNWDKIFANLPNIKYSDKYVAFEGKIIKKNLLDINSSDDIVKELINPVLKMLNETRKPM